MSAVKALSPAPSRGLVTAVLALVLLTGALYAPVRHHGFLTYDDAGYVSGNRVVRQGLTAEGFAWAFTATAEANWHPATWLSHMLDVELFGLDAGAHHLVNVLLHTVNATLLLALVFGLTGMLWPSALVAALFAVHPLHVESVAWVSERKDLLASCFALLAALAFLRAVRRGAAGRSVAAPLLFALALLSKPMPVTLPFLLLLLDWWPLGRWSPLPGDGPPAPAAALGVLPPARLWAEKAPLFLLAAASSVVTYLVQSAAGAVVPGTVASPAVRLANAVVSCVAYLEQTFVPHGFSIFYPHTFEMPETRRWATAAAVLGLLALLALRHRRRRPSFAVGVLWYLGTLVPVLGLVQVGIAARADRYTYLPLVGIFVALAWGGRDLARDFPRLRAPLAAAAAAAVLGLAAAAAGYLGSWADDEAVFQHALRVTGRNELAHAQLGLAAMSRKDWGDAERHLRDAIRVEARVAVVHANLGIVLDATGRREEAIAELRTAVALDARAVRAREQLGFVLVKAGRAEEGVEHLRSAVALGPDDATARYNLGRALADLGRLEESTQAYREAFRLSPDSSDAANNIGQNLALQGKIPEAREWFSRAVALDPANRAARENLDRSLRAGSDSRTP